MAKRRPKRLAQNIEYVYFSDRLAQTIEAQQIQKSTGRVEVAAEVSAQPLGVGIKGQAKYATGDKAQPPNLAARADGVSELVGDLTVEMFDPNGVADFVHAETDMWWGSWFVKGREDPRYLDPGEQILHLGAEAMEDTQVAYFGSAYTMESGERVLACLFGSKTNLLGYYGSLDESRIFGWAASTVHGIELLLTLAKPEESGDADIHVDEDRAFKRLARSQDDSDLVTMAATIVAAQGIYDDRDHPGAFDPHNRGFTIGEGTLEWLARSYIWRNDIQVHLGDQTFDSVFIGAPIWVRAGAGQPLGQFGSVYWMPGGTRVSTTIDPREGVDPKEAAPTGLTFTLQPKHD